MPHCSSLRYPFLQTVACQFRGTMQAVQSTCSMEALYEGLWHRHLPQVLISSYLRQLCSGVIRSNILHWSYIHRHQSCSHLRTKRDTCSITAFKPGRRQASLIWFCCFLNFVHFHFPMEVRDVAEEISIKIVPGVECDKQADVIHEHLWCINQTKTTFLPNMQTTI